MNREEAIETIRKEIERKQRIARYQWRPQSEQLCQELLSFLDTLPEQPVEGLDLDVEIGKWMVEDCGPSDFNPYADHWCADDIQRTARHFYELGQQSHPKVSDNSLEKEIDKEWKPYDQMGFDLTKSQFADIARHFAEWGAEHLKR